MTSSHSTRSAKLATKPGAGQAEKIRSIPLEAPPVQELQVQYRDQAPPPPAGRHMHPRRKRPALEQGAVVPDPRPSRPLELSGPRHRTVANQPGILAATANLVLVRNVELGSPAGNNAAADVDEPSVATKGATVFYTGNWYAALSTDGGSTFRFVDPFHAFPDPPGMRFCCDQVVQYIPKIDMFVWSLQYTQDPTGANIQRLAFAKTADVQQGRWSIFDITPQSLGLGSAFLDFPDLTVGEKMLYFTTNAFQQNGSTASVVLRMPIAGLSSGSITPRAVINRRLFSLRVAQNCGTRAFWAAHVNTSTLGLFTWDESAARPQFRPVTVAQWDAAPPGGFYDSRTPDHFNWLGRADERIVGATMGGETGNEVWFAWGANRGGVNHRPHPYVQIARIDAQTFEVIENINLWHPDTAVCYAALASNTNGEVGASYMVGGATLFPSHMVGILTGDQMQVTTAEGKHGPEENEWGDYLTVRRYLPNGKLFAATGFTLERGTSQTDGDPRFVVFGRSADLA